MNDKQQMMELYKEFMYTKENFVNRSFATNKFHLIATTICLISLALMKEFLHLQNSISIVSISLAGFAFAFLLWANQDAYSYLLKIKFNSVIDKMEESFCFQPCIAEKKAMDQNPKKKSFVLSILSKNFVFTDIQKTFALTAMMIFVAAFFWDLVPIIINSWTF